MFSLQTTTKTLDLLSTISYTLILPNCITTTRSRAQPLSTSTVHRSTPIILHPAARKNMSAADLAFTTANAAAGSAAPPPPPPAGPPESAQHPLANYKFSTDELRVLRECNVESFWQRSLPLGTAFGVAAYMAVRNGYLKGNTRYGAGPKAAVGVIVGYFLGKFSYQQRCAEKIMQLPNSKLAEMLKMRKCGGIAETFSADQGFGAALSMSPFGSATDQYSDVASKVRHNYIIY